MEQPTIATLEANLAISKKSKLFNYLENLKETEKVGMMTISVTSWFILEKKFSEMGFGNSGGSKHGSLGSGFGIFFILLRRSTVKSKQCHQRRTQSGL